MMALRGSIPAGEANDAPVDPPAATNAGAAGPARPVGERAVSGVSWMMLQMIATRVITLVTSVVVSRWLLQAEDFAAMAMANSVCTVLALIQPTNLSDILVQRQGQFRRWANSAFWLSVIAGVGMLVLAAILAPLGGHLFHSRIVPWLILIVGATPALNGLSVVWQAEQAMNFRFRQIASISTVVSLSASTLTIVLACLGCGPLSLAAPALLTAALTVGLYMRGSEFRPHLRVNLARWAGLFGDITLLAAAGFFSLITTQADNFFLGIYRKSEMGNYVWAYGLSLQFAVLAVGSLRGALLPAFSSIREDRARADVALRRTVALVSLVAMPMCILMVPAIPAVVRLVFSAKWDGAIRYVQILLPSMSFFTVAAVFVTTIFSRRLYGRYLAMQAFGAVLFVACVWPAAAYGGPVAVAFAVSLLYSVGTVMPLCVATYPSPLWEQMKLAGAMILPFLLATGSATIAWRTEACFFADAHDWKAGATALAVGVSIYTGVALLLLKADVKLLSDRLRPFIVRFLPSRARVTQ